MRWLFLLMLMLNSFYYLWHQQEAPLRATEVMSLSQYKGGHQDIRLLNESDGRLGLPSSRESDEKCLYLGGFVHQEDAHLIEQRLISLDIQSQLQPLDSGAAIRYWVKIAPVSRRLVDDGLVRGLTQDFSQLKNKIMSCQGIASAD
ncbi:MAG: hypothetical protein ACOH2R_17080 [Pseudomonas sp.]